MDLNLAGANKILDGARAKAASMELKLNFAVVDDGGHLIAFARMDGARPASIYTAMTKAATAATLRQATGPLPPGTERPDPLLNLSVQNTALVGGGKFTTLFGGLPVTLDGQVMGAVGVGCATGEQDAEIARAGIQALLNELGSSSGDGESEQIVFRGSVGWGELVWEEVGAAAAESRPSRRVRARGSEEPSRPSADHPWRRGFLAGRGSESSVSGVCCATR